MLSQDRRRVHCRSAAGEGWFGVDHGDYTETVVDVPDALELVMGNAQTCVRTSEAVYCWGGNFFSGVGSGTWWNRIECPTRVLNVGP